MSLQTEYIHWIISQQKKTVSLYKANVDRYCIFYTLSQKVFAELMQHKHLELPCQCASVPEAHGVLCDIASVSLLPYKQVLNGANPFHLL